MEQTEFQYRKVQCNDGHWSQPIPAGGVLPKTCPVCGMPYDRRQNRPVPCHADGSVAEDNAPAPAQEPDQPVIAAEPVPVLPETPEPAVFASSAIRRQAALNPGQPVQTSAAPRRRVVQPVSGMQTAQPAQPVQTFPAEPAVSNAFPGAQHTENSGRLALYILGERIPVPDEGGYLGREELGGELFAADFMISRRHCYVRPALHAEVQVQDAGSLNGTFVDDGSGRRRLREGETVLLKPGARLYLADLTVVVAADESE